VYIRLFAAACAGLCTGALAMFMLDPQQGRRRRALVRDKAMKAVTRGQKRIESKSRDIRNRAKGLAHEAGLDMNPG
jgi:hypothetical protein